MYIRAQFESAATKFFQANPSEFKKYFSPTLLQAVVAEMQLPSVVSAKLAFDALVADGVLQRTDGLSDEDDARVAAEQARSVIRTVEREVTAEPLTKDEMEYFSSLDPRTLSRLYFGEDGSGLNEFAARYRLAMRQWNFAAPQRFNDTPEAPSWVAGL